MEIVFYEQSTTPSTNDLSKQLLPLLNKDALTVVYTWQQTGGRGQFGKHWRSTHKDVTASFCFFLPSQNVDCSALVAPGAAAVVAVAQQYGLANMSIKWPNDVLIQGKKLAGILCELIPLQSATAVVLGIGLNVNSTEEDLRDVGQPATSLFMESQHLYELPEVLSLLSTELCSQIKSVYTRLIVKVTDQNALQE